jgi:hypothetical protein
MGLQEDLKARTSALISQQMASWVVEIQRAIQEHQAVLVRALDELGENVARYDEKVDERAIAAAVAEVVARQPASAGSADYSGLKASIAAMEKGTNLSEVLTHLVTEANRRIERVAMFIVKSNAAVGWYGRGFVQPELVKSLQIPLSADTVFRVVNTSRHATRGHISHSPGTPQALARLGGEPQGILAVPLILRDKVAAILYCDTREDEVQPGVADSIEILVVFASKVIDLLSGAARPAAQPQAAQPPSAPPQPSPAGGPPSAPPTARPQVLVPSPPAGQGNDLGSATVMWPGRAGTQSTPPSVPTSSPPKPASPTAVAVAVAPHDQKAHDDAKRFARLVVSEIKLYNEAKVAEGRKTKDIYERLKEDIERGRQMYQDRVPGDIRRSTDYFTDELVRILAGGDASALGPM